MAKNMLLFSSAMGLISGISEKLDMLSHTCKGDKKIDNYCKKTVEQLKLVEKRVEELFNTVEKEQKPAPVPEPEPTTSPAKEELILQAEEAVNAAQIAFVEAENQDDAEVAQQAVNAAVDTLEALLK